MIDEDSLLVCFFDVFFNWDVSNGVILYWDVFC